MTYNVHSCVGTDAQLSPGRIAEVIARANVDVVCLQEVDSGRARTRRIDQALAIAEQLAMNFHFHPAIQFAQEQYGDAILSPHPLRLIRAGPLPKVNSLLAFEARGALWVAVSIGGIEWQVINTHFGLGRAERRRQAAALASSEWIGAALANSPVVLCGDLNSRPASCVHAILGRELRDAQLQLGGRHARTFATQVPFVCLDYVFVSPGVEIRDVRTLVCPLSRVASDHFPLLAELEAAA